MSKIICDICGTSYPETAKQCPICGSVQPGDVHRVTNEVKNNGKGSTGYTQVKGGHFTKSNVKKRTKDAGAKPATKKSEAPQGGDREKDNRGLVITAIVLLLAVIGVVIYIAIGFFKPYAEPDNGTSIPSNVPCTAIRVGQPTTYSLTPGASALINATPEPANTTDVIEFTSADEQIATVNKNTGNVTAVSVGTTYIYIKCGSIGSANDIVVTINVIPADVPDTGDGNNNTDTGNNEEKPNEEENKPNELSSIRTKVTLYEQNENIDLFIGNIQRDEIEWTSENKDIVMVLHGVLVARKEGTTKVHAKYKDIEVVCDVTCKFTGGSGIGGSGNVSPDGESTPAFFTGKIVNVQDFVNVRKSPGNLGDENKIGEQPVNSEVSVYQIITYNGEIWCRISKDGELVPRWIRCDFIDPN